MKMINANLKLKFFSVLTALMLFNGCSDPDSSVLAEVNDHKITQVEFKNYLKYKNIPAKDLKRVERELDLYLQRQGLAEVMQEQGRLDSMRIELEINEFRKQMIISRYMEKFLTDKVTEEAVKNFYATNKERYQSNKVHIAHILIRSNSKMTEVELKALGTKAHEIHGRITSNGDFVKIAEKYSEDKMSAKKGGDLGWIIEGAIDPLFSKTSFALKKGEVSKPIKTSFGYHIIKCLDEAKIELKPFDKARGTIRYELRQKAKQAEMQRLKSLIDIEKKEKFNVES